MMEKIYSFTSGPSAALFTIWREKKKKQMKYKQWYVGTTVVVCHRHLFWHSICASPSCLTVQSTLIYLRILTLLLLHFYVLQVSALIQMTKACINMT